jgi:hypothetical protein
MERRLILITTLPDGSRQSYDVILRRNLALLLLAVMTGPMFGLLFAAGPEPNLPACCRRSGQHHCAQMAPQADPFSGPALQVAPCPFFPIAKMGPARCVFSGVAIFRTARLLPRIEHKPELRIEPFHGSDHPPFWLRGPPFLLA